VTPALTVAGYVRWLALAAVLGIALYVTACGSDGGSEPVTATPEPSKLSAQENFYFQRAVDFFDYQAVEPAVSYTGNTPCGNGTMCCATGCLPYHLQSCYWPGERNEVALARVTGGVDACASVAFKLKVEFCNTVWCQAHPDLCGKPDQYFSDCGRSA
jgi:hypothetical protein